MLILNPANISQSKKPRHIASRPMVNSTSFLGNGMPSHFEIWCSQKLLICWATLRKQKMCYCYYHVPCSQCTLVQHSSRKGNIKAIMYYLNWLINLIWKRTGSSNWKDSCAFVHWHKDTAKKTGLLLFSLAKFHFSNAQTSLCPQIIKQRDKLVCGFLFSTLLSKSFMCCDICSFYRLRSPSQVVLG